MDTWETGMGIAFLMELWERGIINEADIAEWVGEPIPLEWGNHHTMEQIIEATALQKNTLGQILQGGVYQAAKRIGELRPGSRQAIMDFLRIPWNRPSRSGRELLYPRDTRPRRRASPLVSGERGRVLQATGCLPTAGACCCPSPFFSPWLMHGGA